MKILLFAVCLFFSSALAAAAQSGNDNYRYGDFDEGELNVWTKEQIFYEYRRAGYSVIKQPRFGRHKNFDRVVFDFEGTVPGFIVSYQNDLDRERWGDLQVLNKTFLVVEFYFVNIEGTRNADDTPIYFDIPRDKIKSKIITEVANNGWWEGDENFAIGVKSKKDFRVMRLSNPARLVVDIKH
jgi:hypothetical protein